MEKKSSILKQGQELVKKEELKKKGYVAIKGTQNSASVKIAKTFSKGEISAEVEAKKNQRPDVKFQGKFEFDWQKLEFMIYSPVLVNFLWRRHMKLAFIFAALLSVGVFAQDVPKLSETELLQIQILNLQLALQEEKQKTANLTVGYGQCHVALTKDISTIQRSAAKLQQEITKNHEGFSFNIETGKFTPKVEPKEEPAEKKQ